MRYTDWLIPRLRELENQRKALENIPERIKLLEMKATAIRASAKAEEPVSGGTTRGEDRLLENIAERDELAQNLKITRREVQELEKALAALSPEEQRVLEMFYINRRQNYLEQLCAELCCEKSQIYRVKERALVKLARILYGQVKL